MALLTERHQGTKERGVASKLLTDAPLSCEMALSSSMSTLFPTITFETSGEAF